MYEEGLRTPIIFNWPGHVKPGVVNDSLVSTVDLFPTLLQLGGKATPPDRAGLNLLPILFGGEQSVRNAVVVHMTEVKSQPEQDGAQRGSWMGRGGFAVRSADWYYINNDSRPNELYEMRHDPWQRTNVIDRYPEVAMNSRKKLANGRSA